MMTKVLAFIFLVIAMLAIPDLVHAQDENVFLHPDKFYKKFMPKLKVKRIPTDTAYIKAYPNYLSLGMHLLSPKLFFDIHSKSEKANGNNASSTYRTNISDILGFNVSYRHVTAGFSLLLKSGINQHDDYAKSFYRTATIKYNSPIYTLQFRYLKLRGLTDINTQPYRQRQDIVNKQFQFEGVYNFHWKKYSYLAPLTFSQRQVKSRAGILLKTGVYYNEIVGDSNLISKSQQQYYDNFINVRGIRTFSIKLAPGIGGNLVFLRRIYFSMAIFPSFDIYFYNYSLADNKTVGKKQSLVFVVDGQASVGYQSKRFYGGIRYEINRSRAPLVGIRMNMLYAYAGLEIGYRFNAPRAVKKVYKDTMPPGM